MQRSRFVNVTTIAVALLVLPLALLVSGCSAPNLNGSEPATASTPLATPTPVSAPQPNSNGAMPRANVQGTGVYVTKGVRQLTGRQWSFKTQLPGETTSPAIQGPTVYFSTDGRLYAVDTATGTEKWNRSLDTMSTSAPAVAGDTVYVGGFEVLYALSAETGGLRWGFPAEQGADDLLQDPVADDGTVYFGGDKNFYAVDSKTGEEKWKFELSTDTSSVPTVYDGTVYIGTYTVNNSGGDYHGDTYLYALDSKTGQEKWQFKAKGEGISGAVAAVDGVVYMSVYNDGVRASIAWRFP